MKSAAKAWIATIMTPVNALLYYMLSQTPIVSSMPNDMRDNVRLLILALLSGLAGVLVYFIPNRPVDE